MYIQPITENSVSDPISYYQIMNDFISDNYRHLDYCWNTTIDANGFTPILDATLYVAICEDGYKSMGIMTVKDDEDFDEIAAKYKLCVKDDYLNFTGTGSDWY